MWRAIVIRTGAARQPLRMQRGAERLPVACRQNALVITITALCGAERDSVALSAIGGHSDTPWSASESDAFRSGAVRSDRPQVLYAQRQSECDLCEQFIAGTKNGG